MLRLGKRYIIILGSFIIIVWRWWLATLGGNIATVDDQMVSEVEVEAMAASPEFPKYTTTDADGYYEFINLVPGDYYVEFGTPEGYFQTTSNTGDDTSDSDMDENGQSHIMGD